MRTNMELSDYLAVLRRRKLQIVVPAIVIALITVIVACTLPPAYRSKATILIERQAIPAELITTTVTGFADERIQMISERVMTYDKLWPIAEEFGLHGSQGSKTPQAKRGVIVARMKKQTEMETVSFDVVNERSGRLTETTIAFKVSFEGESPEIAQQVTARIVDLYLDMNRVSRTKRAEETAAFFATEANKLEQHISDLETKLAVFKQKNVGALPEFVQVNLQLMEQARLRSEQITSEAAVLEERKAYLGARLATGVEGGLSSLAEQELALAAEYARVSGLYSPEHPDVVRLRRQIEALGRDISPAAASIDLENRVAKARIDLVNARRRYSDSHPDVVQLNRAVEALEKALSDSRRRAYNSPTSREDGGGDIFTLQSELQGVNAKLKATGAELKALKERVAGYEARLFQAPEVEREYLTVSRNYKHAIEKHREIKDNEMKARLAAELERAEKAERFSLLQSPKLPMRPSKPNILGILLLGGFLAVTIGFGYAAVVEYADQRIHNARDFSRVLKTAPIGIIPYIENGDDVRHKRKDALATAALVIAAPAVTVLLAYAFRIPLDQLWFTVLERVSWLGA